MRSKIKNLRLCPIAAIVLLIGCQTVPYTGRRHMVAISESQEKAMGEQAYAETLKTAKLSKDKEKVDMIKRVGARLAQAADKPDFNWEFNLIEDDKMVNAWCLPGGKVAFYTGILPVTQDETGVAVVMGHEIAHALARHGAERMTKAIPLQMIGQIGSLFFNTPGARTLFNNAYGLGAGGIISAYSRSNESESDHIGLIIMAKAGYDPRAAVDFWGRMAKLSETRAKGSPLDKFLSTHPSDDKRQKQIQQWLPEALKYYQR